jgi:hypothetical protein
VHRDVGVAVWDVWRVHLGISGAFDSAGGGSGAYSIIAVV